MRYFILLLPAFLALACGSATNLTGSAKSPDFQPKKYEKLTVLAFLRSMDNRVTVEQAISDELQNNGVNGRVSFDMFPLASNTEIIANMDITPEQLKESIRKKVEKYEIDGLLTIRLLDAKQEEHYVEGSSFFVSGLYAAYPPYTYNPYDYYAYTYSAVYTSPGYYVNTTTYFLEVNLYDIATEKLIWTAQISSKDPSSITKEAARAASLVVSDMLSKEVLLK